ncbi:MAG: hypothetical protein ACXABG_15950 [Promethearchaeota archaeon]
MDQASWPSHSPQLLHPIAPSQLAHCYTHREPKQSSDLVPRHASVLFQLPTDPHHARI